MTLRSSLILVVLTVAAGVRARTDLVLPPPADSLQVELFVPAEVHLDELVPITIHVSNQGAERLELPVRGRPIAFDVIVSGGDEAPVWRRGEGRFAPRVTQVRVLGPGERLAVFALWDQRTNRGEPVAPGTYSVRGVVLADWPERLETAPAALRITRSH